MRAREFIKEDDLPDSGKDTWSGGGSEFEPDWTQQIGVDSGSGYQRAQGNLPGGVNLSVAADAAGPAAQFAPQRGVNITKGPASLYLGDRGAVSGSYNIPIDQDSSVSLSASGQKDYGVTGVGAQYQRKGFTAGVNQPNFPGAKPQFNVGYSAQFEDSELDEMAGEIHGGVRKALMSKGYKYLGSGIDKQAYLEPGTGQVLIVFGYRKGVDDFSPDQRMFIDWINYCNANKNNPHLPRFSGFESFEFGGKKYIQARMEALRELPDNVGMLVAYIDEVVHNPKQNFQKQIKNISSYATFSSAEEGNSTSYELEDTIEYLGGEQAAMNLLKTVYGVKQFGRQHGFSIDLHRGNYMARADGTIVVNDPFVLWLGGE